ncbi:MULTISPECIES: hypothetical protein [Rhizobium/Agrobacterium group]|uniref:hypothetical protein n=1 Tax=Rhizobium/Agrobacterium group TaxID=227290 RepID=UPI000B3FAD8D|nr:hypothetical protein [Allorhizobium ampelinum]MCF1485580.1 hypothetical protein [Allorhizobium ampelinum]NSZ46271.1 hypothetical protein [Agrobacterium vitis]NTA25367.1 hypothetical protein [Allorhizobium ampelinum]OVE97157.1 hypothetical protein B7W85_02505 [Allorhizobium ampelinum]
MFYSIEGLDGSGKSTLFKRLQTYALANEFNQYKFLDKKSPMFRDKYVARHMSHIQRILWNYAPDDPMWLLGDVHWMHIISSWFSALDNCVVQPEIAEGRTVIANNWMQKYVSRFAVKDGFPIKLFKNIMEEITQPDLIVFLDVDPKLAAERKAEFNTSETGRMDGEVESSKANFIKFQSAVREKYLEEVRLRPHVIIDAEQSDVQVFDVVRNVIFEEKKMSA